MSDIPSFVAKCNAWAGEVQAIPIAPSPPPVGIRISVIASCKVRAFPVASEPGVAGSPEAVGKLGTVRAGTVTTNGYRFIDFDDGVSGWAWPANFVVL